jgi:hypothetical protein
LRRSAEHGAVLDAVLSTDRHSAITTADPRVRLDDRAGSDLDLTFDDAVGADFGIGRDLRAVA